MKKGLKLNQAITHRATDKVKAVAQVRYVNGTVPAHLSSQNSYDFANTLAHALDLLEQDPITADKPST
ncbi:hypothetical protein ACVFI8_11225 [Agarivorans sp. MS3-6]|uniref:hypothetical protein n=1 Tax=Agarivorans sp. TSD2052 TaxID=2937286 RepID=UPI00200CAEF6|nr:hypothetical protein [Agarivorans sp. TSD2052]UPW18461.1 hypothetical protein M0C34_19910 [Agarivorans sp. TSD2052]